jgi:hypothetical protein
MGKQTNIRGTVLKQRLTQIKWLFAVLLVPFIKLFSLLLHHPAGTILALRGQMV